MAEDSHPEDPSPQGGVFGNLPDSRPGKRSPRRRSGKDSAPTTTKARSAPAQAKKASSAGSPQPPPPGARAEGSGGIEDLAWAGVAAAAEAATLGVRLAGRALDALRGSPERE